jgi:hypothetical protein
VLLELARPVTLLCSMLSLLAVFHTAFLGPEISFSARIYDSVGMLLLAAGCSLVSGLTFREGGRDVNSLSHITETFPVRVFFWTTGIMAVLFLVSWYLETHCIFYRDVHF